mmetsp:Transcript_6044/g.13159  ORF Transcript_6044/g.13159 Transcript_6044/m.13159 type:complete len:319 (-) Transcript_6044:631-1587(-)
MSHNYPYKVDYNDHFETPLRAYEDILPLLDLVSRSRKGRGVNKAKKKNKKRKRSSPDSTTLRTQHILYDPYYCAGKAKELLQSIGFRNVVNEKRDFYADVRNDAVPEHDTFITNPPYSQDHKERCIEYAVQNLRRRGRPFFLLMPNYVALKEYYRDGTALPGGGEADDCVYIVPPSPYEYDHPEGTGHEVPPFASLWFCGVGRDAVESCRRAYNDSDNGSGPRIACSVRELQALGAVKSGNRKNPKQRRKMKKMLAAATGAVDTGTMPGDVGQKPSRRPATSSTTDGGISCADQKPQKKKKRKSKHRDASGIRVKKRF